MTNTEHAAHIAVLQYLSTKQREDFRLFRAAVINYLQKQVDNAFNLTKQEES